MVQKLISAFGAARRSLTEPTPDQGDTSGVSAAEGIAVLAWQEQVRMLEAQMRRFEAIRTRASTVVAIAGIGATFIASRPGPTNDLAVSAGAIAIALFALALALAIYVMAPQPLKFGGSARTILCDWYGNGRPSSELHEFYAAMAGFCEGWIDANTVKEDRLLFRFQVSAALLVGGLAALLVSMLTSL